jgi:D-alanyl-D-alanine carboxypeptidase
MRLAGGLTADAPTTQPQGNPMREHLQHVLQQRLVQAAAEIQDRALFALHLQAPSLGLAWQATAGCTTQGDAAGAWRIASITKSYVAAAVLRLMEQGRLALDESIATHLPTVTAQTLRDAGYDDTAITVRMLLDHTSGIPDFVGDEYVATLLATPGFVWTRAAQLALALRQPRLGVPGARYVYCDTNYSLLGEVLEQVTGLSLAPAVRRWSGMTELGLQHTWWETLEPDPPQAPPRIAQQYQHGAVALPVAGFHASSDLYGAGGLLATLPELVRYFRALVSGRLFERAATAAQMRTASAQSRAVAGMPYGLGLELLQVEGTTCWGHGGFWGTVVWHCPALDFTVAVATSSTEGKDALKRLVNDTVVALAATPTVD